MTGKSTTTQNIKIENYYLNENQKELTPSSSVGGGNTDEAGLQQPINNRRRTLPVIEGDCHGGGCGSSWNRLKFVEESA